MSILVGIVLLSIYFFLTRILNGVYRIAYIVTLYLMIFQSIFVVGRGFLFRSILISIIYLILLISEKIYFAIFTSISSSRGK